MTDAKSEAMEAMQEKPILVYLASPYSHPDPAVRHQRFVAACVAADELMRQGLVVFSPIAHSHSIEINRPDEKIDGGEFWLQQDFPILDRCDAMVVLCIDGWFASKGVQAEIERIRLDKPFWNWTRGDCDAARVAQEVRRMVAAKTTPAPETILAEATRITSTERQRDYGHPRENFAAIAGMWNAYKGAKKDADFTPSDVAAMFALTKMARQANAPKRDNWVDLAGYARCGAQCDGFED